MTVMDRILSKLPGWRRDSNGYRAFCPSHQAHHDPQSGARRSLSLKEENDGTILANCFKGCTFSQIMRAINMEQFECFGDDRRQITFRLPKRKSRPGKPAAKSDKPAEAKPEKPRPHYDTPEAALFAAYKKTNPTNIYKYEVFDSEEYKPVLAVGRLENEDGKTFKQASLDPESGKWVNCCMEGKRPPYNLRGIHVAIQIGNYIIIVEGEKAADALNWLGLYATTSAGGCTASRKTDWEHLRGANVLIWPDKDEPGEKFAREVIDQLKPIANTVRIIRPDHAALPDKGDAYDWVEMKKERNPERSSTDYLREDLEDTIKNYLEQHPDEAVTDSSESIETVAAECIEAEADDDDDDGGEVEETPFPIECMGEYLRDYIDAYATAIGVPYSYLALPVITILASLLCGKRRLRVTDSWNVHPIIWAAVVAQSGAKKSSAYAPALEELDRLDIEEDRKYREDLAQYADCKARHRKGETSDKPIEPRPKKVYVTNTTYEGACRQMYLQGGPVLVISDELSAWLNMFKSYGNKDGSTMNGWLQLHKMIRQSVSRSDPTKNYTIPRAAANVFGTIQAERLVEAMACKEFVDSGFLARCLLTFAKCERQKFRKVSPKPIAGPAIAYNLIVRNLYALRHPKEGLPPDSLEMSPEADDVWADWYDLTMADLRKEAERWPEKTLQRTAWENGIAKIEELPARLAIVLHAVDCIGTDRNAGDILTPVSGETMANAIKIATWFLQGLRTVCRMIADQPANYRQNNPKTPEEYVLSKFDPESGERLLAREILRKCRRYDTIAELKPVLDSLVQNAFLIVEPGKTKSGTRYRLA